MFDYKLPLERIAQHPSSRREDARLLVLDRDTGRIRHSIFSSLGEYLRAGDLLVVNDSRVFPARLQARKSTGGGVELLVLADHEPGGRKREGVPVLYGSSKPLRPGQQLLLEDGTQVSVLAGAAGGRARVRFECGSLQDVLGRLGSVPLPPYIRRPHGPAEEDRRRYQTVYADRDGSVAAPTAGLHFTQALLASLADGGIGLRRVTLHVGPGTFTPLRGDLENHRMEGEWCEVSTASAEACRETRRGGGRVVAVGTTSVRSLESAALAGTGAGAFCGETDLFIRPGFRFRAVDALITNFHLPGSTLLALVAAFAGAEKMRRAYEEAIVREYGFYSYGDAMLIL